MITERINILLIGAGAVGSYYVGKLSNNKKNNIHITALCKSNYEVAKNSGIEIKSVNGSFIFNPNLVIKSISEYKLVPDYIIIATKVLKEIDTVSMIKEIVNLKTSIVLLQNGINIENNFFKTFTQNEIISCLAFITVSKTANFSVNHQANGWLEIGNYPKGISKKTEKLAQLFNNSNVKCSLSKNIQLNRWKKLLWNAAFNPISVLAGGLTTKEMTQSKEVTELIKLTMNEILLIANKSGFKLDKSLIDEYIHFTKKMPANKTSMLLDYENKRPMEIEAILGNTIEISNQLSISTPYLKTLYSLLINTNLKNIDNC